MKIISGIFGLIILALVLCFALPNAQPVAVVLWPLDGAAQVPLYLIALLPLICGLMFGGFVGWACSVPHRLKAHQLQKEVHSLQETIIRLQNTVIIVPPVPWYKKLFRRQS